jgi:hypothetical protein
MKEPLVDVFQDFEKQRASLMMELERTQHANRLMIAN